VYIYPDCSYNKLCCTILCFVGILPEWFVILIWSIGPPKTPNSMWRLISSYNCHGLLCNPDFLHLVPQFWLHWYCSLLLCTLDFFALSLIQLKNRTSISQELENCLWIFSEIMLEEYVETHMYVRCIICVDAYTFVWHWDKGKERNLQSIDIQRPFVTMFLFP
jgi:hypothetical protein